MRIKRNKNNITYCIRPTEYEDFDLIGIGSYHLLVQLSHKIEHSHLIKKSKFGGIPILILDTCDTLRECLSCIKQYNNIKNEVQKLFS
jgi:hypothetical protein